MKKILFVLCMMGIIIGSAVAVYAEETVDVYVNGEKLITDQPAIIYQDRTMVPLRAICEELNCKVNWNSETQTALIENEITMVAVQINNYAMSKKDRRFSPGEQRNINIDVPPILYNDRTLVPVRAIAEAINAKVDWDGTQKRVYITLEYDWISDFYEDMAIVEKNGKTGYIDKSGKIVIPPKYDLAYPFSEGLAQVSNLDENKRYQCGYIDKSGREVIPLKYSSASWFNNGTATVHDGLDVLVINTTGKVVLDLSTEYWDVEPFSEGLAWVSKDYKCGYIDQSGELVIPMIYDYVWGDTRDIRREFVDGNAPARISGKHGYINQKGEEVIPIIHEASGAVSEGVVCMKLNGKWAYYDMSGRQITEFIFDDATDFENGYASVLLNGEWITIDKETLYQY